MDHTVADNTSATKVLNVDTHGQYPFISWLIGREETWYVAKSGQNQGKIWYVSQLAGGLVPQVDSRGLWRVCNQSEQKLVYGWGIQLAIQ